MHDSTTIDTYLMQVPNPFYERFRLVPNPLLPFAKPIPGASAFAQRPSIGPIEVQEVHSSLDSAVESGVDPFEQEQ